MAALPDAFWNGFADEVEKLAGEGSLAAATLAAGAGIAGSKQVVKTAGETTTGGSKIQNARLEKQTGKEY